MKKKEEVKKSSVSNKNCDEKVVIKHIVEEKDLEQISGGDLVFCITKYQTKCENKVKVDEP